MAGATGPNGRPDGPVASRGDAIDGHFGEEELRLILESITEYAVITIGLDEKVKGWNTGAERLLGFTEAEILGRNSEVFYTPEDRAAGIPQEELRIAREEGRAADARWHLKKDGTRFWGDGYTLPLGRGPIRGYLKIFRDETAARMAQDALRARTVELETVLRTVPVAVWFTHDPEAREVTGNPKAHEFVESLVVDPPPQPWPLWGENRPEHVRIFIDGEEARPGILPIERAAKGEEIRDAEIEFRHADGRVVTYLGEASPIRDGEGRVVGAVAAAVDITDRKRIATLVEEREETFRQIANNIPDLAWMADAEGNGLWHNLRWTEYTGVPPEHRLNKVHWNRFFKPSQVPEVMERWQHSVETGRIFEMVINIQGLDGCFRPFLTRAVPLRDGQGRITRWFGTNVDISERVRAERHQQLLINELNHRVKNTLAMVQSIATQTFQHRDPEKARKVFETRLMALARAHDVLTRENWEGAALRAIVQEAVAAHGDDRRFRIRGPDLRLTPRMALTLAMALSELATNAAKYGALLTREGFVRIVWTIAGETSAPRLHLRWSEHRGPAVRPPVRKGFGSRLIERALQHELGSEVKVSYDPTGLVCTIDAPLPGPLTRCPSGAIDYQV